MFMAISDEQRRARAVLLHSGLHRLEDFKFVSRKEFFALLQDESRYVDKDIREEFREQSGNAAIAGEIGKKSWQRDVIVRLIEHEVIYQEKQDSQVLYTGNLLRIKELFQACREGRPGMDWFLFPSESAVPLFSDEGAGEGAGEGELAVSDKEPDDSEVQRPRRRFTVLFTAEQERDVRKAMSLAGIDWSAVPEDWEPEESPGLSEKTFTRLFRAIASQSKRMGALEQVISRQQKVLEANQTALKKTISALDEVVRLEVHVRNLVLITDAMKTLVERLEKTVNDSWHVVRGLHDFSTDKHRIELREAVQRVQTLIGDIGAVKELLLDVAKAVESPDDVVPPFRRLPVPDSSDGVHDEDEDCP